VPENTAFIFNSQNKNIITTRITLYRIMVVDPQCREDYKRSFLAQLSSPNSSASLSSYLDAHNAYVTQLHATNGMVDQYNQYVLPQLLQVTVGLDHTTI